MLCHRLGTPDIREELGLQVGEVAFINEQDHQDITDWLCQM
jgi:hypothetical protein